jgi:hypothetical protein
MNYFLGIIGPFGIIFLVISYLLITIYAIVLILKNEKKLELFLWLLIIFFIPILGSIIYILKHKLNSKNLKLKSA